ncbi:alpha/beta fold hydrolase [Kurthia sibirica]|nr:alpha/beta hydrolase [Kurthia sibirica]GEK34753.1 hydrolase [Kurthia sibirica]
MFAAINGTKLYFDIEGSGYIPVGPKMVKKPVLVAVHGGPGSDHSDFKPFLTPLSEIYQIVYLDQRSNGQSERVDPATCTFDQLADDIEALRLYLGLEKISVLGHSFGGMIAQVYATSYPESVDKLLLVNTAPSYDFYREAKEFASRVGRPEQIAKIPELFEGNIRDDDHLEEWWTVCWDLYWHDYQDDIGGDTGSRPIGSLDVCNYTFKHLMPLYDVRAKLPALKMPTLIVTGRHDWITPLTQGEVMHDLIPNSELAIFEKSGHMPFIEEQQMFLTTVREFLSRGL